MNKPELKIFLMSGTFSIWLWYYVFDSGLGMTMLFLIPSGWFFAMVFAFCFELINDFLEWVYKK